MISLLFQTPTYITSFNALIALVGLLVMLGIALVIILSKKREEVQLTETRRADANANLLKTRDTELEDCNKKCAKCNEELEDVTAELRATVGIKLKDLFDYWQIRERELAEMADLKAQIRVLEFRKDPNKQS